MMIGIFLPSLISKLRQELARRNDAIRSPAPCMRCPGLCSIPWGDIAAASVVVTVPLVILVLIFQKRIVEGVTAGAVKG